MRPFCFVCKKLAVITGSTILQYLSYCIIFVQNDNYMAVLKIHSDVVNEEDRVILTWWGLDGTSFDTIDAFVDSIPEDDNVIELRINCRGGEVMEGWTIHDKLRSTGKEITAIVEGKCASIATLFLLAAPKERRFGYQNASLLIHEPYFPEYSLYNAYGAEDLRKLAEDLEAETTKLVNYYVERTGSDEQVLRDLMKEDKYVDMNKAVELGFISEIKSHASASANKKKWNNHSNNNSMSKEKKVTIAQAFNMLGVALGITKSPVNMDLTTADGTTLTIEREEGDPQVGDAASPDGEHAMPDGTTIVVEGGVITEIKPAEGGGEGGTDDKAALDAANARIKELEAEVAGLKANAKSKDDLVILNAVKTVGGLEGLKKIASSYVPKGKNFAGADVNKDKDKEDEDPIAKRLEEAKAARKERMSKK